MQNRGASATKPVSPMHGLTSNQMQSGGENYVEVDHMFKEYKEMHDEIVQEASTFREFYKGADVEKSDKSKLKMYLEEGLLKGHGGLKFNALEWWNIHQLKYPILSKMARDVLAIPISTVASEATFSASGRVIDPYRSALKSTIVEMLLCGGD
ncbi:zinc finger BED domain-containing protein RICESLEEPER 2-like protein [Tanacetum coccineum]